MLEPHVVSYLVSHGVAGPCAVLGHRGERPAGGEGVDVPEAAAASRLLGQEDGRVRRVAYGRRITTLRRKERGFCNFLCQ